MKTRGDWWNLVSEASSGSNQNLSDALFGFETGVVNVKAPPFFAKGDGVTDDTAAIQAAIDSLDPGGTLYFPAGVYLIKSTITLPSNYGVNLIGAGPEGSIVKAGAVMNNMVHKDDVRTTPDSNQGWIIDGLQFNCDRLANVGLLFEAGRQARINNFKVFRHLTRGIQMGDGVVGTQAFDCQLTNIWIDGDEQVAQVNWPEYGLYMDEGSTDNKIRGLSVNRCKTSNIYVLSGHNFFFDCHIWSGATTQMYCQDHTTVVSCYFDTPGTQGLHIDGNGCLVMGCQFWANTASMFYNPSANGIKLGTAADPIIICNHFDHVNTEVDFTGTKLDVPGVFMFNTSENLNGSATLQFTTDELVVNKTGQATAAVFETRTDAGETASLGFKTGSNQRWLFTKNNAAESGSDAGSDFAIQRYNDAGAFQALALKIVRSTGLVEIREGLKVTGNLGFYGTTPIAKPTVTGSRGGNAALADLLTELANIGLITDSST